MWYREQSVKSCVCTLFASVFFMGISQRVSGSDRLKVTAPPAGQAAAEELVGSLASACNAGDFMAFMDHFTPSHAGRSRKRLERAFIANEPNMDIRKVTLLSEDEDTITFGVKYAWHEKMKPEVVLASRVKARRINGEWKLDGEQIVAVSTPDAGSHYGEGPGNAKAIPANWDPFNPPAHMIDPSLEHLRGDIGIQPGRGCADGRCRLR